MRKFLTISALVLAGFGAVPLVANAQTPPSAQEIAVYTGLHAAAHKGDAKEIARLIAGGGAVDAKDSNDRTPLHVATFAKRHAAMRALAKGGANPRALDRQLYDPVTIAAVADDLPTMKVALEIGGNPREITSIYVGTALIAAAHLGHDGVVRELIRAGAPLDHVNNLGWTALIEAVILGNGGPRHIATVKALVEAKARRDLADRDGATPLDLARQRGYTEMIKLLQ